MLADRDVDDQIEALDNDPITEVCLQVYPEQSNFVQASSKRAYWLGGDDPLDYINIFESPDGYYHFISLGLSDIHGDGRVHKKCTNKDEPSGYGYELTIKVKKGANGARPTWPIDTMQSLAKYTFENGGLLNYGDHIPNILSENETKVKHLLIAKDSTFSTQRDDNSYETRHGRVKFMQLVGCTDDELYYVQQWSASKLIDMMKETELFGAHNLVTDLLRSKSLFEVNPSLKEKVKKSIKQDGSHFGFVKANAFWRLSCPRIADVILEESSKFDAFSTLQLFIDFKTAKLLPTVLKQRLEKQNSFIINGVDGSNLILIPENFNNQSAYVTADTPIRASQTECQVLISQSVAYSILKFIQSVSDVLYQEDEETSRQETFHLDTQKEYSLHLRFISDSKFLNVYSKF